MESKTSSLILFICSLIVIVIAAMIYHGPQWQDQSATNKQDVLWSAIMADTKSGSWPNAIEEAELLIESMNLTEDWVGEDFPPQGPFNITTRQKLIHSVGAIAPVMFVPEANTPYTGMFQGSQYAFIRFSTATPPDTKNNIMIPGISMKFLSDNIPSVNLMAMFALTGQPSFNFFLHDMTNHVPYPNTANLPVTQKLLLEKFRDASFWPTMIALSHISGQYENGTYESNPVFPWRLIFHPTDAVHSLFPDQYNGQTLCEQLATIPAGTTVYEVYAIDTPENDNTTSPLLIGQVVLNDAPTASSFADGTLFFQHHRMDNDLAIIPEWIDTTNAIVSFQANYTGGFTYPDLPFN